MKKWLLLALIALFALSTLPALAQSGDDIIEPVALTAEPTAEAGGVIVNVEAPEPEPSADPAIALKWWQVLAGLATAFGAGGIIGIAGVGTVAMRVKNDRATMTAIEELAKSVPADVAKSMLALARSGKAIAEVTEEVFDGVPVGSKPAPDGTSG